MSATNEQLLDAIRELQTEITGMKTEMSGMKTELREEMGGMKTELREEMTGMKSELQEEMGGMKTELREEMGGMKSELREEISGVRSELQSFRTETHDRFDDLEQNQAVMYRHLGNISEDVTTIKGTIDRHESDIVSLFKRSFDLKEGIEPRTDR